MNQVQTRAISRNSYTLDLPGLSAHARDTIVAIVSAAKPTVSWRTVVHRPRGRVGPLVRGSERHAIDAIRIR